MFLQKVLTLRSVFEGSVTECRSFFNGGTFEIDGRLKKHQFYIVFSSMCFQKYSFGFMFLHKILTLRGVFEGSVTECRSFFDGGTFEIYALKKH